MSPASNEQPQAAFDSPLSAAEVQQLDSTVLPALERHHLRLLAHALRTLQRIAGESDPVQWPSQPTIERWLLQQPQLSQDNAFAHQLALQLSHAGRQLAHVAERQGMAPLQLDLADLISWAREQADQRLASGPPGQPPPGPTGLPADR